MGTMNWDLKIPHMLPSSMIVVEQRTLRQLAALLVFMLHTMMIDEKLAYTMAVTEQWDVYSFGVVVLETIMGSNNGNGMLKSQSEISAYNAAGVLSVSCSQTTVTKASAGITMWELMNQGIYNSMDEN
ncbi:unnamed protein product [Camellia sinensis]